MRNFIFVLFALIGCVQTENSNSIVYDFRVTKEEITVTIRNNSGIDYFFQHPQFIFFRNDIINDKNVLTESITGEMEYDYKEISFPNYKFSSDIFSLDKECNLIFFKLKKKGRIVLVYRINNSKDLFSGNYSVIVNNVSCNLIKKKLLNGYLYYDKLPYFPKIIKIE